MLRHFPDKSAPYEKETIGTSEVWVFGRLRVNWFWNWICVKTSESFSPPVIWWQRRAKAYF